MECITVAFKSHDRVSISYETTSPAAQNFKKKKKISICGRRKGCHPAIQDTSNSIQEKKRKKKKGLYVCVLPTHNRKKRNSMSH